MFGAQHWLPQQKSKVGQATPLHGGMASHCPFPQ
jgi:hypothetical protein